jgi:hypothetical protein
MKKREKSETLKADAKSMRLFSLFLTPSTSRILFFTFLVPFYQNASNDGMKYSKQMCYIF